jgi:hypothetical protein
MYLPRGGGVYLLTWMERTQIIEELRRSTRKQLKAPNEHERHLRDSGGISNLDRVKVYHPEPNTDKLMDFSEYIKKK